MKNIAKEVVQYESDKFNETLVNHCSNFSKTYKLNYFIHFKCLYCMLYIFSSLNILLKMLNLN